MNSYSVKAECARNCKRSSIEDRTKQEARVYIGEELEAHQLSLVPLYAHTQHGACGLHVTLNGESVL